MTASPLDSRRVLHPPLAVLVRSEAGGPVLAREPVSRADLSDVVGETWRELCLRSGHHAVALSEVPMRLKPRLREGAEASCAGLEMEATLPDGRRGRREFTLQGLRHVAERAIATLMEAQTSPSGQSFVFEVVVDSHRQVATAAADGGLAMSLSVRRTPLTYLRRPVRPLLERGTPVAMQKDGDFPVFYTQEAFVQAEFCALRGADQVPPVETGGVLIGSLVACPDSGELAVVITDVIEVQDAKETRFSLAYSDRSWIRIQNILKARQNAYPGHAARLCGQTHGHPWLPNDGKVCAECVQRPTCSLTSLFVSQDDQSWHRSVFAWQPWALCHLFGWSARGERVNQLYGLKDGRLQARGYHLLPDFTFD